MLKKAWKREVNFMLEARANLARHPTTMGWASFGCVIASTEQFGPVNLENHLRLDAGVRPRFAFVYGPRVSVPAEHKSFVPRCQHFSVNFCKPKGTRQRIVFMETEFVRLSLPEIRSNVDCGNQRPSHS